MPSVPEITVAPQLLQSTAKIVLTGDSNAGKTCLARRLAEDGFQEGQNSTHGMQIWKMSPEKLHPDGAAPEGHNREVFLWDLGGQTEYQLVNQLFLHDSSIALVLFDPDRGSVGLESARAWNQRLETRSNPGIRKFLIRSKADLPGIVSNIETECLKTELGFYDYIEVSARDADHPGIAALREKLHHAIDWPRTTVVSRPAAFQHIRDYLTETRQAGVCVLYFTELKANLENRKVKFELSDLEITLGHLSREGEIVDLKLTTGDRVVVLRVDVLSRYAGSIVQIARRNPRGVPAMEQDRILAADIEFPGLKSGERLTARPQEKAVLEAAVRLMIERGVCFDHQGLLIFPTLFDEFARHQGGLPPSAPIYYDFSGPIDNIYASLVARLAAGGRFGPVRLWARYAEFGGNTGGTFGVRRAGPSGRGHLDLYFDEATDSDLRVLFRDFVNDHLTTQGVKVLQGLAFACANCSNQFSEQDIRYRLEKEMADIRCQRCEKMYSLFAAAETAQPESTQALIAFKTDLEHRTRAVEEQVADRMSRPRALSTAEPLRILHLSDLHFNAQTKVDSILQPISADLTDKLAVRQLDYLIVSGDFADKCNAAGFDAAAEFLQRLSQRFAITPLKTILVPGNHDYEQLQDHFSWQPRKSGVAYPDGVEQGAIVLTPNERYAERFKPFCRFYHSIYTTKEYPQEPDRQFELVKDPDTGLHFLCLNSAWRIDQFRPERAELNHDALNAALLQSEKVKLGILVWHHAAQGDRKIKDTKAVERLAEAGFRLLLHGDVHEERDEALNYLDRNRTIHVVGAGAFGASAQDRPESTPRLYSLLEVARDLSQVRVMRRSQRTPEGPYDEYAIYSNPSGAGKVGEYKLLTGKQP